MSEESRMSTGATADAARLEELDRMLQNALRAPDLPAEFGAGVLAAALHAASNDLQEQRRQLEYAHALERQRLRADHVRLRRQTLGVIVAAAFTAGAAAAAAVPWLRGLVGESVVPALPFIAVGVGLALGALAGIGRFLPVGRGF